LRMCRFLETNANITTHPPGFRLGS
jgi:hypothetical protein